MIRGVLFDMDGVLVNNTQAHVKAFEIFCERYGVEDWQHKLQTAFGMGNDDIMRLILPEEIIREKGMKALGEEKEAIYREVYAPEIRPVRGLVELLEELRRRVPLPLPAERRGRNQRRTHGLQKQVGRNARFLRPDRCRGDPHRQPLVGNGFLDLHAGPSPTLRTDLERDRLQL